MSSLSLSKRRGSLIVQLGEVDSSISCWILCPGGGAGAVEVEVRSKVNRKSRDRK